MRNGDAPVVGDLLKGALAGVAATWLMDQATTWMYSAEGEHVRRRENEARGDKTAYESAAEKMAGAVGRDLTADQRSQAGTAIHWGTGIAAAAAYAALRHRVPGVSAARGAVFGVAFFLLLDELMNPALGLTPGPQAFPWQTHARGLGGHAVLGLATELILEGLDRVA